MTEAQWLSSQDPDHLLNYLAGRASDRKLRLFALACCRKVWHLLPRIYRSAIEATDRWIDDADLWLVMDTARRDLRERDEHTPVAPQFFENEHACGAVWGALEVHAWHAASAAASQAAWAVALGYDRAATLSSESVSKEHQALMPLLRDLFQNPFRRSTLDPAIFHWESGTVVKVAEGIYQERAFDQLPILADALQDAGCVDDEILSHLHSPGPHERGCWAVDLVLGKN